MKNLPHPMKNGIDCPCTACDSWRASRVRPGCLVKSVSYELSFPQFAAATWIRGGELLWGWRLDCIAIVIERCATSKNDTHMDAVTLFVPDRGFCVTSAKWLTVIGDVDEKTL